jgi:hypothetical protein
MYYAGASQGAVISDHLPRVAAQQVVRARGILEDEVHPSSFAARRPPPAVPTPLPLPSPTTRFKSFAPLAPPASEAGSPSA